MRSRAKRVNDYGSPQLNTLARDVQAGFDSVLDLTVHKATLVWQPPFLLYAPYAEGLDRLSPPDVIRCERAVCVTDPTILVTPGGCSWQWAGVSQARIDDVGGLTVGSRYDLTFTVLG